MKNRTDLSLYHLFKRSGLTTSQRRFSVDWLGAAPNYIALRGARPPSPDVLIGLFQRLWVQGRLTLAIRVAWTLLWLPEETRR